MVEGRSADQYTITFGWLGLPIIAPNSDPAEMQRQLSSTGITVATVGQFTLTAARLAELRDHINQILAAAQEVETDG